MRKDGLMRVMYRDDHDVVVVMECSSVAAIHDDETDTWAVVATEMGRQRHSIIKAGLSKDEAHRIMWNLFGDGGGALRVGDVFDCP